MMRRFRFVLAAVFLVVCLMAAGGVFLTEAVLRPYHGPRAEPAFHRYAERTAMLTKTRFEDVSVTAADGSVLRGWLFRASPPRGRAVLFLHGQGDNRSGALGFALFLLVRGYDALVVDSRAHGASGGALATYGLLEADDVKRWAQWLKLRDTRVFALGESMGAANLIQALAAGAPIDAAVAIASVRVPVLLIHGAADVNIPPEHSRRILARARGRVELWSPPEAGHIGVYARWPQEFERRVAAWFDAVR